jgi:hypothetical protein
LGLPFLKLSCGKLERIGEKRDRSKVNSGYRLGAEKVYLVDKLYIIRVKRIGGKGA